MRLRQENPDMFDRFSLLMEGRTDDLLNDLVFSDLVVGVYNIIRNIEDKNEILSELAISRQDIVRCLGVKRSNAIDLGSIGVAGGVALYPTYSFMNSHCFCNTRYHIMTRSINQIIFVTLPILICNRLLFMTLI